MNKSLICFLAFALLTSTSHAQQRKFVDVAGLENNIKPGDDFFRYVNRKWLDTARIAPDQSGVGSYSFMNIPQKLLLQKILDSVSKAKNVSGTVEQQVGDFYASGMDVATINKRGFLPIKNRLAKIDAIKNSNALLDFVASELKAGNSSIISFGIGPDDQNSGFNIAHVYQGGTGLPERDYYFKKDSATLQVQVAYKKYLATLFQLTGNPVAKKSAEVVYGIEQQLAGVHKSNVELRDVKANYHKVKVSDIDHTQRNIGWANFLKNIGASTEVIDMAQVEYYEKLDALLRKISVNDWKLYLKANTLVNYAPFLSKAFVDADFAFNKVLSGQDVQKPRKQLMTEQVDRHLGMALGQLYVKRYFDENSKNRVLSLVNNLQKAFENRISSLEWMSDSTKAKAKEKLYAITKKIGYPDKWKSYDKVKINRTTFFENVLSLNKNEYEEQIANLNKAVDRSEWFTTPATVTAYYNPAQNEVVFPAGILQYPYFDFSADDAIIYGGIGMVIGHEMTHAFDDQGAQYDKDGNVKNWWTQEDEQKFKAKTKQLADQYSSHTVLDTVHIKGNLTLGENTADNGGIAMAYDAFKLTTQGKDTTRIDGFTPDQRFFLSIARIWRVKTRDAFLRNYVKTNPHSPAQWRVNGPLLNFAPFYKAFEVKPSEKNYKTPDERVKIW